MAWKLKGRYNLSCSCTNVCPCSTASAPPDNPDGTTICWAVGVWDVREGNLDGVNLSGVPYGLLFSAPDVISNGNWKVGLAIGPSASDDQTTALEEIISGQHGGPFADLAPLIAEFTGVERTAVMFSDMGAEVGGQSYTYEPLRGVDGNPTTIKNTAFGFAPEFEIGSSTGQLEVFGHSFDASYGEAGDFEYTSESHERIRA